MTIQHLSAARSPFVRGMQIGARAVSSQLHEKPGTRATPASAATGQRVASSTLLAGTNPLVEGSIEAEVMRRRRRADAAERSRWSRRSDLSTATTSQQVSWPKTDCDLLFVQQQGPQRSADCSFVHRDCEATCIAQTGGDGCIA
jgi:hypothetical protein